MTLISFKRVFCNGPDCDVYEDFRASNKTIQRQLDSVGWGVYRDLHFHAEECCNNALKPIKPEVPCVLTQ
jgi:hypothetical protein